MKTSVLNYLRSLTQLLHWLGIRCNQSGIDIPWVILWPGTPHSRIRRGREWRDLSHKGPGDFSRVPRQSGAISQDSDWVSGFLADQKKPLGQYSSPCWSNEGVLAIIGFPRSRDALAIIESITREFASGLDLIHQRERLHARIDCLEACLATPDHAIAFATVRGDVLASTPSCAGIAGRLNDPSHQFLRDQSLKKLPQNILEGIRQGQSQMRLGERQTVLIQPVDSKTGSTQLPRFRIEILTEPEVSAPLPVYRLSACERTVFDFLMKGLTNKEIANERSCSISTIRHQAAAVYRKMGINRRQDLIVAYYSTRTERHHVPSLAPPNTDHRFPISR